MNSIVSSFGLKPELSSDSSRRKPTVESVSHFNDCRFSEHGVRVVFPTLIGQESESAVVGVDSIVSVTAPFQIADVVVGGVSVNVIDDGKAFWVGYERQCDKPVNKEWGFLSLAGKVYAQMFGAFGRWRLGEPLSGSLVGTSVDSHFNSFGVRPNLPVRGGSVKPFPLRNIFHCFPFGGQPMIPHSTKKGKQ